MTGDGELGRAHQSVVALTQEMAGLRADLREHTRVMSDLRERVVRLETRDNTADLRLLEKLLYETREEVVSLRTRVAPIFALGTVLFSLLVTTLIEWAR